LGEKITDNHYAEKWICDYRDRLALKYYPNWLRKIYLRIEKRAHKKSNATFQVSKGTMDDYVNDFKNIELENLHIITNGYEKVNKSLKNFSSEKLIFSYTGSLYSGGKRSFKILSEVIKQCAEEGTIDIDKVIIKYAGNSTEELNKQIKEFGIDIFENYGSVSRERAIEIQNESDILILLTWNTKNEKGVITGKFYEYLIAHKPIICLISGNEPNSELSLLIRETNVGISCEEINYNLEFKMLKNYLIGQYNNKMLYGSVKYEGNNKEIDKYDYKNIVDKVESICKSS